MPNYVISLLPFFKTGSHDAFSRLLLLCWETIGKPSIETRKVENLNDCELLCYLNDNCGSLNFNKDPENNLEDDSPRHSCKLNMEYDGDLKIHCKMKTVDLPQKMGPKQVSPVWYISDTLGCAASRATFFFLTTFWRPLWSSSSLPNVLQLYSWQICTYVHHFNLQSFQNF